ncbi:HTH_38 domain-containing protein [Trichonephila clavipes]|nr:HTH_38 domain-containing protein [Trichonephila clavipes]
MSRKKQQSAFDQVSEFDRGRIVTYRDCRLSFREIGRSVGRNQTTVMRICDRWMQEDTTNRLVDRIHLSTPIQVRTATDVSTINGAMKEGYVWQNGMKLSLLTSNASVCNTTKFGIESGDTVVRGCKKAALCPAILILQRYYGMGRYWISLSHSSSTNCRYFKQPALHLRGVPPSCPSLPSFLGYSHISTG